MLMICVSGGIVIEMGRCWIEEGNCSIFKVLKFIEGVIGWEFIVIEKVINWKKYWKLVILVFRLRN